MNQKCLKNYAKDTVSPQEKLLQHRQQIRRFSELQKTLPIQTQATCPSCREIVSAEFTKNNSGKTQLTYNCKNCKKFSEIHHDAIWTDLKSDREGSAKKTFSGSKINPVIRHLPRTVQSLCPECSAVIIGRYFQQDEKVLIEKTCPDHGYFSDVINSDAELFLKASQWSFQEHAGLEFPQVTDGENCPSDCGLCNQHMSSPCLAQIDLTNRCNMNCPICFANANSQGFTWQPSYEEIVRQLKVLREMKPHPCTAIQFSGGEPTIHPDFLKIISTAKDLGFTYIQIATNGITLADPDFARAAAKAGLHTLYLQFDGIGDRAHQPARNYPGIWAKKIAAVENARRNDLKICLVPTILKGINDNQVQPILEFAIENIDVVSGISWQPVSFTGRCDYNQIKNQRYTLGDLAHDLAKYPGVQVKRDMFPLSLVVPISDILEAITGDAKIRASSHPTCAFGTYFLVSPDGKAYPFPSVIDVEGMFSDFSKHARRIKSKRKKASLLDKIRLLFVLKKHWRKETAPPDLSIWKLARTILGMVDKRIGRGKSGMKNYRSLMCAGMHFQDRYNFDVERVKRCVILYSTPAGVFPFCTYNCGPEYRHLTQEAFLENPENINLKSVAKLCKNKCNSKEIAGCDCENLSEAKQNNTRGCYE